ncbi:MAG TPA: energy transducer TonB [Nitrospirota bacterium]|nr:energy transducer TonB [Nitrospirota bacterium]
MNHQLTGLKLSLFIHAAMFALIFGVSQLYAIPGRPVAIEIGILTGGADGAKNNSQGKVVPQLARPENRNKVATPVVLQKEARAEAALAEKPTLKPEGETSAPELHKKEASAESAAAEKPVLGREGETSGQKTANEPFIAGEAVSGSNASAVVGPLFNAAYLNNPKPLYPPVARRMKVEGTVVVQVLVNSNGKPENVRLEKSSGSSMLDQAALTAVQNWSFVPAREGNKIISAWVDIPLRFRLLD